MGVGHNLGGSLPAGRQKTMDVGVMGVIIVGVTDLGASRDVGVMMRA